MRVMLGEYNEPSLLVYVEGGNYPTEFNFWVENGAWEGSFNNGYITINHCSYSSLNKMEILSDNQDRLRGEYQDVFQNWDNPDYVAPQYEVSGSI